LAAIATPITPAEYNEAIARIEQLVAAERSIAAHEMDEAHARQAAVKNLRVFSTVEETAGNKGGRPAAAHQPLSTKETG
jgi:hypothetical protein